MASLNEKLTVYVPFARPDAATDMSELAPATKEDAFWIRKFATSGRAVTGFVGLLPVLQPVLDVYVINSANKVIAVFFINIVFAKIRKKENAGNTVFASGCLRFATVFSHICWVYPPIYVYLNKSRSLLSVKCTFFNLRKQALPGVKIDVLNKFYSILLVVLSVATGALFLYSAYTKLAPIESFEYTITEYMHLPLMYAAIAARFLVGLEAGLGSLIVLHFYGRRKWPLKAAFALVVIFSLYLAWLWIVAGNNVNCGCFGDAIWMSPSASLIKNIILLASIWILIKYHHGFEDRWASVAGPLVLVVMMALSYILFPVFKPYKIDLTTIYTSDKNYIPAIDLTKGKHIIAFSVHHASIVAGRPSRCTRWKKIIQPYHFI